MLVSIFKLRPFNECDINDPFFDSLRADYHPDFNNWFEKKSESNEQAYVYLDGGIQAFLYIKDVDDEEVPDALPKAPRIKIGTLKISEDSRGQRIGEGAIGIALWKWQQSNLNEIYITAFKKHDRLIAILESFGFVYAGKKRATGENVYVKDKRKLQYADAKRSFPYINPDFKRGKYIPINDDFHDRLFQYSELKGVRRSDDDATAASNGISKVFIATPFSYIDYRPGDVALIYRRHTGDGVRRYKSAVTSFCTIMKQTPVKQNDRHVKTMSDYMSIVGNKSVYSPDELKNIYKNSYHKNIIIIEMAYNGYFGAGKNVNYDTLETGGLFNRHPYEVVLTRDDVLRVLRMGGKGEQDIDINKSRAC
ncbi:hypothetical protein [Methanomassiliicoccus luminyensis]|uniref:hypothetical protein n=1 Tax=Methanomassiliicoccus luminyensis TaxID=1080712 RepID=UPI0003634E96|nr:hypothetical protein [Methanomassiliicoccus luminyensis]